MPDTHIPDGFSYKHCAAAYTKAREVEDLLNRAESLLKDVAEITHAEIPDLEDAIPAATALSDDIKEALEEYERGDGPLVAAE